MTQTIGFSLSKMVILYLSYSPSRKEWKANANFSFVKLVPAGFMHQVVGECTFVTSNNAMFAKIVRRAIEKCYVAATTENGWTPKDGGWYIKVWAILSQIQNGVMPKVIERNGL